MISKEYTVDDETNIIKTIAPIPGDVMKEYFRNNNTVFVVDAEGSHLQGLKLLTYLTNIALPIEITFSPHFPFEKFDELMYGYMKQDNMIKSQVLRDYMGYIILSYIGYEKEDIPLEIAVPYEYIDGFIYNHQEELSKWVTFLDSTEVLTYYIDEKFADMVNMEKYPVIDDDTYVGVNIANLYLSQLFVNLYQTADRNIGQQYLFIQQATRYIFGNSSIYNYINQRFNPISIISSMLLGGMMRYGHMNPGESYNEFEERVIQTTGNIANKYYQEPKFGEGKDNIKIKVY